MSNVPNIYETVSNITDTGMLFFFLSKGNKDIIKAVQYSYVLDFTGKKVYNLGFGNYEADTDSILDEVVSNNGDPYRVFNTVLGTIPLFFAEYKDAMLMVSGSDSRPGYQNTCRLTCKKKCSPIECKNVHRRINLYRNYIIKNYWELSKQYQFHAGSVLNENQIVIEDFNTNPQFAFIFLSNIY